MDSDDHGKVVEGGETIENIGKEAKEGPDWMICGMAAMFTYQAVQRGMSIGNIDTTIKNAVQSIDGLFSQTPGVFAVASNNTNSNSNNNSNNNGNANNNDTGNSNSSSTTSSTTGGEALPPPPDYFSSNSDLYPYAEVPSMVSENFQECDMTCFQGSNLPQYTSTAEQSAITAAGGVGPLLGAVNMDANDFAKKLIHQGPASALSSIMPPMGNVSPAMNAFFKALEKDSRKLASILPKEVIPGVEVKSIPLGKPTPTAAMEKLTARLEKAPKPNPSTVAARVAAKTFERTMVTQGPDIWHKGTDLNIFQIVSQTIGRASSRVSAH